jgi:hypothetical protein
MSNHERSFRSLQVAGAVGLDIRQPDQEEVVGDLDRESASGLLGAQRNVIRCPVGPRIPPALARRS